MENTEEVVVVHPWDQQEEEEEDDVELEKSLLIARRKNLIYIPLSTTLSADFTTNNGAPISVTNDQDQQQEQDDEIKVKDLSQESGIKVDEDKMEVKDSSQENGMKVDENEKKKEKEKHDIPEYSVYYDTDKGNNFIDLYLIAQYL